MAEFCTIDGLARFLQISIADGNFAAARAIREASATIQNYCGQAIEKIGDDEITLDVGGRQTRLFLPELPVVEISEVVENGTTLATSGYKLGRHGILHRVNAFWYPGIQTVTITYTHGYATIPDDVMSIAERLAARAYQSGLRTAEMEGVPGIAATSLGDYSVSYTGEQAGGGAGFDGGTLGASGAPVLLPSEKRLLNRYKIKGP